MEQDSPTFGRSFLRNRKNSTENTAQLRKQKAPAAPRHSHPPAGIHDMCFLITNSERTKVSILCKKKTTRASCTALRFTSRTERLIGRHAMERNGKGLLTLAVAIAIECNSFCRFGSVLELSLGEENPVTRLRASPELRLLDEFSARYRLVNLSPLPIFHLVLRGVLVLGAHMLVCAPQTHLKTLQSSIVLRDMNGA